MNKDEISAALADLPLGGLRFFDSIGSTNDEALAWISEDAQDLSIVVADEQTAGRGRSGQKWLTPPGSALAFSLILRPSTLERTVPGRITGLGALALAQCCADLGISTARIKWPNDLLLNGRKAAGILVESAWAGNVLDASVLGIGLNVTAAAVPPASQVTFPATSLETELGRPPERVGTLEGYHCRPACLALPDRQPRLYPSLGKRPGFSWRERAGRQGRRTTAERQTAWSGNGRQLAPHVR